MNKKDLSTLNKNSNSKLSKKKSSNTWKILLFIFIIIIIISVMLSLHFYANKKVNDNLKSALRSVKGDCYITYSSSLYKLWNNSLDIRDIVVECRDITVATIDLLNINEITIDDTSISDFSAVIKNGNLNFESPLYGAVGKRARQLGYFDAKFDGNINFTHSNISKLFTISDLTLDFNDIGNVKLKLTVPNTSSTNLSTSLKEIVSNNYRSLNIEFTNTGIISKVIKSYIENKGYDIFQAKTVVLNAIERRMENSTIYSTEYTNMKTIYDFIDSAGMLTIQSDPNSEASLSLLINSLKSSRYSELFRSFTTLPLKISTN